MITEFTYHKIFLGERKVLRNEDQNILIESTKESDSEKDKLINIYNTVIEQDDVKQTFIDLKQASDKMNSLIKLFTSGVRILSEDIELGQVIKGKCSVGYYLLPNPNFSACFLVFVCTLYQSIPLVVS